MPLAKLKEECKKKKLRLTADRELAFKVISQQDEPIKAYDLLDIYKKYKKNAKPQTIYRALDFLEENGFVHKINLSNSFFNCSHLEHEHNCQLFICYNCHKVKEYCHSEALDKIHDAAQKNQFIVKNIISEIYGFCVDCKDV